MNDRWTTALCALLSVLVATAWNSAAPAEATSFKIENADTGQLCEPCYIEFHGFSEIYSDPFGLRLSRCVETIEGEIWADGRGTMTAYSGGNVGETYTDGTGVLYSNPVPPRDGLYCAMAGCDGEHNDHFQMGWPITTPEERGGEAVHMTVNACLDMDDRDPGNVPLRCDLDLKIEQEERQHGDDHKILWTDQSCGSLRLVGDWESEDIDHDSTHQDVEFLHADATPAERRLLERD